MHFIEPVTCFILNTGGPCEHRVTHTTLFGSDSRKRRTAEATRTITNNSFHSPDAISSPPDGWPFVRPGPNPFDAIALRSSASKWSPRGCGNRCDGIGRDFGISGGGDAGRLALKLPDI